MKVDHGAVGAVENFRSEEAFLLFVVKQLERAERVVVVYEAGPLGYSLYRKLKELSVECYVCAPDSSEQQKKRRKNNKIDARNLTSKLFLGPIELVGAGGLLERLQIWVDVLKMLDEKIAVSQSKFVT